MNSFQRVCDFSLKPISSQDRSSVQINMVQLDERGRATKDLMIFNVSGTVRKNGKIDSMLYERINEME
ncbi:Ribosomal protein S21E [Spraguea lophii 42_110]|uniref:Ribosomal protein S21E n=1 Tax=Spraguea lophii (strain 42_110) TaxID=1358809 RepID=S7WAC1_SPRLO|nr:Chain SV0, Ribosomal protein S21E [Spraguea lophii 42_110]7QJH_RV0 Chain RV0, Ribosomal protein S21E [Spraguea lophii 42_110]7QJH_SV0 Chain SV0, Ribosomal protein S21E [Spraguea lophii 42_110]8BR3_SV0 Chain SV0, Ribosomal protein S21E [Spraguea lophii 42_110]8P5D_SV0 Chain SV0, Ribosomal protein S21E [Spraguea lophii 42_110]8P60_RV0 Chain RV0, Ribosomal protein S21E [Spraguea lophii 42_110]8P60_SV0 Chain SV0, Ribosomal protein S21E [Spraguea lophii 42_110]EPR79900.1 Ribosomal protein S21E